MRIWTVLALLLLALGCQHDPHAHLYTTEKPQAVDVVGRYTLTRQTLSPGGLEPLQGRSCTIELLADGTFTATNVPPWHAGTPPTDFFATLIDGSGTWRIDAVGAVDYGWKQPETHWGVSLDSPTDRLSAPGLTGAKPPHGLIYTLGDPDGGAALMLERAR